MNKPSIHITVLLNFQVGLFTAAVFWMFDAPIALNPGGETSQTDHIYSPPQTWGGSMPTEIMSAEVYPD